MSQQPPYGPQDPQQPYQQPYTPYSQGAYPNPYGQMPQRPNHTTRNVLLIVGAVVVLFCGGLFALGVVLFNNVDNAFDGGDYPGSENDPKSVAEGEAFSIRGFDYEKGWTVATDETGGVEIAGLRGTNNRDDQDVESVYLYFDFYQDNARLASLSCFGGGTVAYERSIRLTCDGYSADVSGYDEIEVYDSSYYE